MQTKPITKMEEKLGEIKRLPKKRLRCLGREQWAVAENSLRSGQQVLGLSPASRAVQI
jgi:hypothetical protein